MTIVIKRLMDGALLEHSDETFMRPTATVFGASFEKVFYPGPKGESILLSSAVNFKTFTFSWISGDQTGEDAKDIMEFFSYGEWFSITDTELGLVDFQFAVIDINPDFTEPGITCQARWGMEPKFKITNLSHQVKAAGSNSTAVDAAYTNTESEPASVRITVTADADASWNPLIGGQLELRSTDDKLLGRVNFSFAKLSDRTSAPITWRGQRVIVDSDREVVEGEALISPVTWIPFVVEPGQAVKVKLTAIQAPFTSGLIPWTLDVDAVVIERN